MFAPNACAILCAQTDGKIQVYRLNNIDYDGNNNINYNDQIYKLNKVLDSD